MKNTSRKFKVYDRVKVMSKSPLEKMGLNKTVIIRKFDKDYDGNWYYVSNQRSLAYWLVEQSRLRKA